MTLAFHVHSSDGFTQLPPLLVATTPTDTIKLVKGKIGMKIGVPSVRQTLTCNASPMLDTRTLEHYAITEQDRLECVTELSPAILHSRLACAAILQRSRLPEGRAIDVPFRLLHLPSEIRNAVYSNIFATHLDKKQPNITWISRQVRSEALPLFYKTYPFRFDFALGSFFMGNALRKSDPARERKLFERWAHCIGDKNAGMVQHLVFRVVRSVPATCEDWTMILGMRVVDGKLRAFMPKLEKGWQCESVYRFQRTLEAIEDMLVRREQDGEEVGLSVDALVSIGRAVPLTAWMTRVAVKVESLGV